MSGTVIGTKKCSRCGGTVRYSESAKSGGISGSCDTCKRQTFDRSPKACEGLKRTLAGARNQPTEPADQPANKGEAFSLDKL